MALPEWVRTAIFERDDYTCRYCGVRHEEIRRFNDFPYWGNGGRWVANLHVDHVVPKSRGGTDEVANLVTACPSCNREKYNRAPGEWQNGG